MGFGPEWLMVAIVTLGVTLIYRLTLAILLVPQAPLGLSLMQMAMTVICYPLIVLASAKLLGVRKARPSEGGGRRLRM
jgi:rod shape-determining protein MreD